MVNYSIVQGWKNLIFSCFLFLTSLFIARLANPHRAEAGMLAVFLIAWTITFLGSIIIFSNAIFIFIFASIGNRPLLGYLISSVFFLIMGGFIYILISTKYVKSESVIYFVFPLTIFLSAAALNLYKFLYGHRRDKYVEAMIKGLDDDHVELK